MEKKALFCQEDEEYVVAIRREIHQFPETEYDLPVTTALVKRELDAMGIPYTEKYGKMSIAAELNPGGKGCTAIRADMDALPVTEKTGYPFSSKNPGKMHACGHDAHTAILLGTARVLKRIEDELPCRVRLIFQPCEEGADSGGRMLEAGGVMEGVDAIVALHCDNEVEVGKIGICKGASTTTRHRYHLEFFGKTAHAASPQAGCDALAMAVKTYNGIQTISRRLDPSEPYLLSIGALRGGKVDNVVCDYADMLISVRTFAPERDTLICEQIHMIAEHAAEEMGGSVRVDDRVEAPAVMNDPLLSEQMREAADKELGEGSGIDIPPKMSSEDFSFLMKETPGCLIRLGTRNEALGCTQALHNPDFRIDEDSLMNGVKTFVRFILDRKAQ